MKQWAFVLLALTLPAALSAVEVQQQRVPRTSSMYRLNFTLHVIDGGKDQPRNFALVLEDRASGKIRALTKIPVKSGAETSYIETGIKTDAEYTELEGRIRLQVELQYTGVAGAAQSATEAPLLHEWQSRVEASVNVNEVFVLSTYDSGDGRRYQLDVKAEKIR